MWQHAKQQTVSNAQQEQPIFEALAVTCHMLCVATDMFWSLVMFFQAPEHDRCFSKGERTIAYRPLMATNEVVVLCSAATDSNQCLPSKLYEQMQLRFMLCFATLSSNVQHASVPTTASCT